MKKIYEYATRLRLTAFKEAIKNNEFSDDMTVKLTTIFEKEITLKENTANINRIRTANFPLKKYLMDIEIDQLPPDLQDKFQQLKSLKFIEEKQNIIMIGNPGTGKSHVAIGLGIEACQMGYKVRFCHIPTLVTTLKESKSEQRLNAFIGTFLRYDLIILDELGYITLDKEGSELLFQLLSARSELKSTIVTSNSNFDKWHEIFIDPVMTGAIIDRLGFKSHIIKMSGESYRFKTSQILNN